MYCSIDYLALYNQLLLSISFYLFLAILLYFVKIYTMKEISFASNDLLLLIQEILHYANGKMVARLQDCSEFSILGYCAADCCYESPKMMDNPTNGLVSENFNGRLRSFQMEQDANSYSTSDRQHNQQLFGEVAFTEICDSRWDCGCCKLDKYLDSYREFSIRNGNWVQLSSDFQGFFRKEIGWMPKLHHMHWNGKLFSVHDVHVRKTLSHCMQLQILFVDSV